MEPDDLYAVDLERFVAERGALAKALRGEGHRDEAAEVAKLRKPSAAAWAVNRLVRSHADEVASLWEAGDALREAQSDLLGGRGDARALRAAGDAVRDAVDALVQAAREGLGADLAASTLERVGETLHAAALDEDARAAVAGGRLERELRHVGLGLGDGADVFAAAPAPAAKARAPAKTSKTKRGAARGGADKAAAAERLAEEKAGRAEREAARRRARTAAAEAAKREERASAALRAAEERRERAAAALAEADEALAAARSRSEEAEREHKRAREAFEAL